VNPVDRTALAQTIDHTLLCPTATRAQIETLCQEARDHGFCSVCVGPRWVTLASDLLQDCPTKTTTVIGFPLGFDTTRVKTQQAKDAIFDGADEIDMVADLGAIIEQDSRLLAQQFQGALKACRHMRPAVTLKVILECAALTDDQKALVCAVAEQVGVDFIQTSTGFHASGGATAEDIQLIKVHAPSCQIKAAGGFDTRDQALSMLEAGATRLGTCASLPIIGGLPQEP
jgi:deoxyribose-phosphate aldolase